MEIVRYQNALWALNMSVAMRGPEYVDSNAPTGCSYVTDDGREAACLVGTAFVWLGVPVEFLSVRRRSGADRVTWLLREDGILDFSQDATRLLVRVQGLQDEGRPWGEAVVRAHLGNAEFSSLGAPRRPSDPWAVALADLKDAAHDGRFTVEETDRWTVRHDITGSVFGWYDVGEFVLIASVATPDALRSLRTLL